MSVIVSYKIILTLFLPTCRPSSSTDKVSTKEHEEYLEAEKLGQDTPDACEEQYSDCRKSLMDVFTSFDNPFESLFNTYL